MMPARLSFNHAEPYALPLIAPEMKQHNRNSQCFVPMDVARWVLLVALDVGSLPDASALRTLAATGDQAVKHHIGIWHRPLRVLHRPGRFAALMWTTNQQPEDEEWSVLPGPVTLE